MPHRDSDSDTGSSSRRKHKKTRTRSNSSSSDNSTGRYHRKKKSGHSSQNKSRRRRSRSNSSPRYCSSKGSSSRRRRSGSRHRRSRSGSPGARRRSRSPKHRSRRSRSISSSRRRSWSGSDSPRRTSKKASPSVSPKRVRKPGDPVPPRSGKESDQLKQKIQQVIKAAANANAELRERGLLQSGASKEKAAGGGSPPSMLEQMERARLIDDINAPSFSQQAFVSRRDHGKKDAASSSKEVDNHAAAIFGSFESLIAAAKDVVPLSNWREKPELLIHENLREAPEVKLERWRKKLAAERRKRLNGATTGGLVRTDM